MPAKPEWFDLKITLGNVITIATVIIGAVWWSSKLEARVESFSEKVARLEANDVKITSQVEVIRDNAAARQEAVINRLAAIDARNARIEAILERLERRPQ